MAVTARSGAAALDFEKGFGNPDYQMTRLEKVIYAEIRGARDREIIFDALTFADRKHKGQFRDDSKRTPYVIHPIRVCRTLIAEMGVRSPELLAAALLHDTIEDCGVGEGDLAREFGAGVAGLVASLSRKPNESKEEYLGHLRGASFEAKQLKVADRIDNLRSTYCDTTWPEGKVREYLEQTERYVIPIAGPTDGARLKNLVEMINRKLDREK